MPTTCIVRGCKSRSNQGCGIKFHRLPWRDDLLCKQWLIRAGKSELELTGKRMAQFKNARMCSLHFSAEAEGTSKALPSKNIPDFERQEAVAGILQLTVVAHMESTQKNVNVHQISTDNTGNIPDDAVGPNRITEPQLIAESDTSIKDSANILDVTEDIIPMTKLQTIAYSDTSIEDSANILDVTEDIIPMTKLQAIASSDTSIEDSTNILDVTEDIIPMTKLQTIASSDTSIEDSANILDATEDIIPMTRLKTIANDEYMAFSQKSLLTSPWTPSHIRKRKLFSDATSQVTPKKNKVSIGIQRTPAKQKHTQVTPKQRRSAKISTDISISAKTQTETPSSYLKSTKMTQTDSKITCEKSSQVNISKLETLKTSDKDLRRYTGIEDYKLFKILHKYLVSCCSHVECETIPGHGDPNKLFPHIDSENQLLLVLYKLKRNPIDSVLSSDFNISTGRISEIFKFWIKRMYSKFKIIKIWPSKENVQKYMPLSTKQHFPDLVAIADCVEFCTQVPGGPIAGKQMFSNYKNCHTVKAMYTSAPNGALIHCSDVFGGNSSDKEIFGQSDIVHKLQRGDGLMVDKGFLIKDLIQGKGITLYRPPFLSEKSKQFDSHDRDSGRLIARSRITVENFNARLATFAFLKQKKIPILYMPLMNEIGYICGFLANLGPLIRSNNVSEGEKSQLEEIDD